MTIVCAITDGERTVIGSDRQVADGPLGLPMPGGKWQQVGGWWVGTAGWLRVNALLAQLAEPASEPQQLADQVREAIRSDGWRKSEVPGPGAPECYGVQLIFARAGVVWVVDDSMLVVEVPPGELTVIGDGQEVALGAAYVMCVHAAAPLDIGDMHAVVVTCIDAANHYCATCGHGGWVEVLE